MRFDSILTSQLRILVTRIIVIVNNIGDEYRSVLRLRNVKRRLRKLFGRALLPVDGRGCGRAQGN